MITSGSFPKAIEPAARRNKKRKPATKRPVRTKRKKRK